ncbi:hypothetical protein ABZ093_09865 [Streptomyces cyaneofuscatus]|uniref:hypothetical protein n=1 Tax=Streptomyces cyaneofuscatus TaxID=66883 RepID=UPI0033A298FC
MRSAWSNASANSRALTQLIANVVRHVPGRRCQTFIFRLILVNAVTDDWGVIKRWDGTGKTVWFECVDRRKSTGARARFSPRPPTGPRP